MSGLSHRRREPTTPPAVNVGTPLRRGLQQPESSLGLPVPRWAEARCRCGCLPADLDCPAPITTSEAKFSWSRHVAEWWCTLSSPCFGLSIRLYFEYSHARLQPEIQVLIWGGVVQGIISSLYHATTLEVFSLLDEAWAVLMFHITTAVAFGAPFWYCITHATAVLVLCVVARRQLTKLSVWLVVCIVPFLLYTCAERVRLDDESGASATSATASWRRRLILGAFAAGGLSFLIDRKGMAPTHPLWHIAIGVMFDQSLVELVELPCAPCIAAS